MHVARLHRPLILCAGLMVVLAVLTAIGIVADDRTLLGVPIWLKPFKFSVSIAIYAVTIAWMISLLADRRRRFGWWLGTIIAATMLIEIAVIDGQAARGHRSHFNYQTPLDGVLFTIMGATIAIAWAATLILAILLLMQRMPDRANALAVRLGLIVALAGMGVGFLMTLPTSAELAEKPSPTIIGAHSVGVADGGPGLPLVNWSTTGGDLRAGHFIGLHALQALPLFALLLGLLGRRYPRLRDDRTRTRLVVAAAIFYGGLTALITWQALRGQSIVHPDGLTLAVGGALLLLTLAAAGLGIVRRAPAEVPA